MLTCAQMMSKQTIFKRNKDHLSLEPKRKAKFIVTLSKKLRPWSPTLSSLLTLWQLAGQLTHQSLNFS